MSEMDKSVGIKDKVLAEFVLDLAKRSRNVMEFEKLLDENGAEFSVELINTLFALITKMIPECFERANTFKSF
jgi:ATP-dependent RNA helicase DHX8/PRP22